MTDELSIAQQLKDCVAEHYGRLYQYTYRLTGSQADAEDIVQQSFLNAQENWHQLNDQTRVRAWLFTIARNLFLKSFARSKKWQDWDDNWEPVSDHSNTNSIDEEALQLALNDLPDDYRQIVILYYFNDFSYKEISQQLNVPIGTVMSRLSRGKASLRKKLITHLVFDESTR